jgi:MFS family permease
MTKHRIFAIVSMCIGIFLTSAGYGMTFLLTEYFRTMGGNEVQSGRVLLGGAVGTLIGVPVIGWLSNKFDSAFLACFGSLSVGLGFLLLGINQSLSPTVIIAGLLIGLGWGAYYLSAPLAITERMQDSNRTFWLTWTAAFQMAGIGIAPAVAQIFHTTLAIPVRNLFFDVCISSVIAALFFLIFYKGYPLAAVHKKSTGNRHWATSIITISRTRAIFPLIMVGLGGCIFSSVLTFQTSIAESCHLDSSVFFCAYTITVVLGRFALASALARSNLNRSAVGLLSIMTLGLFLSLIQKGNLFLYILSAILIALGYGLAYTVLLAQTVSDVSTEYRQGGLTWFTLSYFLGAFGFPLIGGMITVHFGTQYLLLSLFALAVLETWIGLIRALSDKQKSH